MAAKATQVTFRTGPPPRMHQIFMQQELDTIPDPWTAWRNAAKATARAILRAAGDGCVGHRTAILRVGCAC